MLQSSALMGSRGRNKSLLLLPLLSLLSSAIACSSGENAQDDADHTERNYAQDNSPYWWASSTYDEFRAVNATLDPTPLAPALPESDPLTVRIQTWLDRVDSIVRKDVSARSGAPFAAPRPIARVLTSRDGFNAWVSSTAVCLGGTLGVGDPTTPTPSKAFLSLASTQALPGTPEAPARCVRPAAWRTADAIKFWNTGKPACMLSQAGSELKVTGSSCLLDTNVPAGADLTILAASPYVQFTTDRSWAKAEWPPCIAHGKSRLTASLRSRF